tara:strand:- start:1474 stop:1854 length:381 start_codon:yes stop_codon:yes gene_type:complete
MSELAKKPDPTEEMLKLATAGADSTQIEQKMQERGATPAQIAEGFRTVFDYYRAAAEFNEDIERGRAYARLNLLFLSTMRVQDYKAALAVQKEINKLIHLYDKQDNNPLDLAIEEAIRIAEDVDED